MLPKRWEGYSLNVIFIRLLISSLLLSGSLQAATVGWRKEGIELKEVLNELRLNNRLTADEKELSSLTPLEAAKTLDYDVLVELSALSIEGRGEPAASHISAALMRGKSVASANKGPVSFHYRELKELAEKTGHYTFLNPQ